MQTTENEILLQTLRCEFRYWNSEDQFEIFMVIGPVESKLSPCKILLISDQVNYFKTRVAGARYGNRGANLVIAERSVKLFAKIWNSFYHCFKTIFPKKAYVTLSKLIIWLSGIKSKSPTQSRSGAFLEVEVTGQLVNDDKICNNIKLLRSPELNA